MPTTQCFSSIQGSVMRVTQLDACGAPALSGSPSKVTNVTTAGFVSVDYANNVDEGTQIQVLNAAGQQCINEPGCPSILWIDITATFCEVDPDLINLFTGWPVVLDNLDNPVGFRTQTSIQCTTGVALEVWSNLPGGNCSGDTKQYLYWLAPYVVQGILGDVTVENDAASFVLTGKAVAGSQWGTGPYNVNDIGVSPTITPAPLISAIGATDLRDIHVTRLAPPTAACGAVMVAPV